MTWRSCSGGTRVADLRRWPGCPPRFLPEGGAGGRRFTEGGSDEGGLEELVEFLLTRSSSVGDPPLQGAHQGETAACASAGIVSQSS